MNREMRRLMEREERRNKKKEGQQRRTPGAGQPGERKSMWQRLVTFLHDVRQELKRVSWPTQEQMIAFTSVTLITTIALTIVTFGLDVVMKEGVLFFVERM